MLRRFAFLCALTVPLFAQTYELRFEVPFSKGQNLPQTLLTGTGQLASGTLETSKGGIVSLERTFLEWPIVRLLGGLEATQLRSNGQVMQGTSAETAHLTQTGIGVGLAAQFWVPFIGLAGEMGLIQRFQQFKHDAAGTTQTRDLHRTWLRVGVRWRLPIPGVRPYLAASYQEPTNSKRPVQLTSATDLEHYLKAQGSGLEVQRLWTFGVGVAF